MYIKIAAVDLYSEDEYRSTAAPFNGRFLERTGSMVNTLRDAVALAEIPDSARFQTDISNIWIKSILEILK